MREGGRERARREREWRESRKRRERDRERGSGGGGREAEGGSDITMLTYPLSVVISAKPATMSSQYQATSTKYQAGNANDGIYVDADDYHSLAHSLNEAQPWWRVDLEAIHCVKAVRILNRAGKFHR